MTTKYKFCMSRSILRAGMTAILLSGVLPLCGSRADPPDKGTGKGCSTVTDDTLRSCFGLGLGIGGFFYTEPDVVSTVIDGGAVRILEEHQREASVWFEGHAIAWRPSFLYGVGFGPFIGLQLGGSNGTFSSFAVGGMFSFPNVLSSTNDGKSGLGLGVGYGWTQVHRLGDGIVEDQPLPAGVSSVRLKQTDIGGLVLMLSLSYNTDFNSH